MTPFARGPEGCRRDRLHDHLADRQPDRGAHPAAVHGRHRRTPVPRVRGDAGGDDPDLRGRLADADADAVGTLAQAARGREAEPDPRNDRAPPSTGSSGATRRGLDFVLDRRFATLLVAIATLVLTALLYHGHPKGLFPTQDTGQLQARIVATDGVSCDRMSALQLQAASNEGAMHLSSGRGLNYTASNTAQNPKYSRWLRIGLLGAAMWCRRPCFHMAVCWEATLPGGELWISQTKDSSAGTNQTQVWPAGGSLSS